MKKLKVGMMVGHQVQKSFYCSIITAIESNSSVLNYKVDAQFSITDGIRYKESNKGVVTRDNIDQKKLKKMIKKNPEWFI